MTMPTFQPNDDLSHVSKELDAAMGVVVVFICCAGLMWFAFCLLCWLFGVDESEKNGTTREIALDGGIIVRVSFPKVTADDWETSEALEAAVRGFRQQHLDTKGKTA